MSQTRCCTRSHRIMIFLPTCSPLSILGFSGHYCLPHPCIDLCSSPSSPFLIRVLRCTFT
ncbi:hypothetical protein SCLCIDRAFT_916040 [Scleroderma citrinum Foug A]|uniref:Uncharacterized protein n=1 Tax=Scleroderma citrinum Foug A TaxID=1036808 RepID=A0A0C3DKE0_9AGAM|nr:hypothetical protein SCLCIDRAFT_916040 [Scleroderma citrinum Foug A]